MMIEWVFPQAFWLALLAPLIYLLPKRSQLDTLFFPRAKQIQMVQSGLYKSKVSLALKFSLWFIIWLLLCATLAQPIKIGDTIQLPREGRNIILAVDISGSMREADMVLNNRRVNRLTMVKAVVDEFIQKRKGDKMALILFGTQAFLQSPLTYDLSTVRQLLAESVIGLAGKNTAIGDAIGIAVKHAEKYAGERILILLTDGQNTAGNTSPIEASEFAKNASLKVFGIGIGRPSFSNRGVDIKTLNAIAKSTGGGAYLVKSTSELIEIYEQINRIVPTVDNDDVFRITNQYYWVPLSVALSLLLFIILYRLLMLFIQNQRVKI